MIIVDDELPDDRPPALPGPLGPIGPNPSSEDLQRQQEWDTANRRAQQDRDAWFAVREERESAIAALVAERRAGGAGDALEQQADQTRQYVTVEQAECIARAKYRELWKLANKAAWARAIGCDRRTVDKLPAWTAAAKRRKRLKSASRQLRGVIDSRLVEALAVFDVDALVDLSDADRDHIACMPQEDRDALQELLAEQAADRR